MSGVPIRPIVGIVVAVALMIAGFVVFSAVTGDRSETAMSGDGKPTAAETSTASPGASRSTPEGDQPDVPGSVETSLTRETRHVLCGLSALSIKQLTRPSEQIPRSDSLRDAVPLLEEQITTWQQVPATPTLSLVIRRASALSSSWQRELESYDQGDKPAARVAQRLAAARLDRLSAAIDAARRPIKDCRA